MLKLGQNGIFFIFMSKLQINNLVRIATFFQHAGISIVFVFMPNVFVFCPLVLVILEIDQQLYGSVFSPQRKHVIWEVGPSAKHIQK